jgi:hypothetical protein
MLQMFHPDVSKVDWGVAQRGWWLADSGLPLIQGRNLGPMWVPHVGVGAQVLRRTWALVLSGMQGVGSAFGHDINIRALGLSFLDCSNVEICGSTSYFVVL